MSEDGRVLTGALVFFLSQEDVPFLHPTSVSRENLPGRSSVLTFFVERTARLWSGPASTLHKSRLDDIKILCAQLTFAPEKARECLFLLLPVS